jgi:DNA-binding transcriptional regulator YiaG
MINGIDIAEIRRALGLSQSELGERLGGLHQASVSRLERGVSRPRGLVLDVLKKLALEAEAARAAESEAA